MIPLRTAPGLFFCHSGIQAGCLIIRQVIWGPAYRRNNVSQPHHHPYHHLIGICCQLFSFSGPYRVTICWQLSSSSCCCWQPSFIGCQALQQRQSPRCAAPAAPTAQARRQLEPLCPAIYFFCWLSSVAHRHSPLFTFTLTITWTVALHRGSSGTDRCCCCCFAAAPPCRRAPPPCCAFAPSPPSPRTTIRVRPGPGHQARPGCCCRAYAAPAPFIVAVAHTYAHAQFCRRIAVCAAVAFAHLVLSVRSGASHSAPGWRPVATIAD